LNLPFSKKEEAPAVTAKTALGQIRQLYNHYKKQSNMWGYTLLSSMALICFWVLFSVFRGVNWSYLSLPLLGILISGLQMRRAKHISRILRQAHEVQQQVDKAEAEKRAREEEEAAEQGKKPKPQVETNGAASHSDEEEEKQ
jgi:hypothetical protein